MKTSIIAAFAIIGLLLVGVGVYASNQSKFNASTSHVGSSTNSNGQNVGQPQDGDEGNKTSASHDSLKSDNENDRGLNLTTGQTLTFSGLTGHYIKVTNESSDEHEDGLVGNASGSFKFTVTSVSADKFNLTITSGTFKINTTTYTVTGGSLTLNEEGRSGWGKGTASGGATFTFHISGIHGNLTSNAQVGAIILDVKVGTSEYHVILGSIHSEQEDSED
jgi:hypothetical protein